MFGMMCLHVFVFCDVCVMFETSEERSCSECAFRTWGLTGTPKHRYLCVVFWNSTHGVPHVPHVCGFAQNPNQSAGLRGIGVLGVADEHGHVRKSRISGGGVSLAPLSSACSPPTSITRATVTTFKKRRDG